MGKTPGKWIKTLLLGKKSPKSNLANGSEKLRSAKKEDLEVSVKNDSSNLPVDPLVVSSQPVPASTDQNDELKVDLESRNELEQAVIKVQAAFTAHQARKAFQARKGIIIKLQAVFRGHLVRRQAIATYSCICGIVKLQALIRGQKVRSLDNGIQFQTTHMETGDSKALKLSTYSWMDKLLASSPTPLPLKIQYGPEEPNSVMIWLERWTQLQVWSPGSRAGRNLVSKSKTKKRNYQEVVESEKVRPKRGVKKQSGGSNRSIIVTEKSKRNVRKSLDPLRIESDKAKNNLRKSRNDSKKGSSLMVKEIKLRPSVKRSSVELKKATGKSAEKKKNIVDFVQIEPEVKDVLEEGEALECIEKEKDMADSVKIEPELKISAVLEGGDDVESTEKEKDRVDFVQIEPEVEISDVLEGGEVVEFTEKEKDIEDYVLIEPEVKVLDLLEGGDAVECTEKEKDMAYSVQIEPEVKDSEVLEGGSAEKKKDTIDVVPKEENSLEEDEARIAETSDLKCSDLKVSSENNNTGSNNTKPSERQESLSTNIGNKEDRLTHSGRKIPSYMAPTASAKARLKGEGGSPRLAQERRRSLPSPANGNLSTTMSPRAHKVLLASDKGSINGDKSLTSSKYITEKSNKTEWKR